MTATKIKRRPWLPSEDAVVRASIDAPVWQVARKLERTPEAIHQRRNKLGIARKVPHLSDDEKLRIRELNGQEYTDTEIADVLGRERHSVTRWRRRMGLPDRAFGRRHIEAIRDGTRAQCEREGVNCLADIKQTTQRLQAIRRGWPAECTPIMCDILDRLGEPRTKRELCSLLGKRYHRCKALCTSRSRGAIWELVKLGLVVRMGRRPFRPGKGQTEWVYGLAPGVACARPKGAVEVLTLEEQAA